MRIAFLFIESYPNYALDAQLLGSIPIDQAYLIESYVRVGLWAFDQVAPSTLLRQRLLEKVLLSEDGNLMRVRPNASFEDFLTNSIYVVQFDSLPRNVALEVHEQMVEHRGYLGFTQVLSSYGFHQAVFWALPHRYRLEKATINVLYSSASEDDIIAGEIVDRFRNKNRLAAFTVRKKDIGDRFLLIDQTENDTDEFYIAKLYEAVSNQWEMQVEPVLYTLQDIAPAAINELKSAVDKLSERTISAADCAQIAVSLRRCLEKVADYVSPPTSNSEQGKYKDRLKDYVRTSLSNTKHYSDYIEAELDELCTRIEKLYNMGNKGVHEDWAAQVFSILVLRVTLLVRELILPLKNVKPAVFYDPGMFDLDR